MHILLDYLQADYQAIKAMEVLNEAKVLVPVTVSAEVLTNAEPVAVDLLHNSLDLADRSSGIASREMLGALNSICKDSVFQEVPSNSTNH